MRRRWRSSKPKALQHVNKCRPRRLERDELQNDLRERERGIEASRQQVLRLLGEASTLRNQLAQIDEYLAAMERDSARSRKEEESASADLARLEQVKAELSAKLRRTADGAGIAGGPAPARGGRVEGAAGRARWRLGRSWKRLARGYRGRRRARIRSKKSFPIALIRPNRVKRLFTAIEHGQIADFKPAGVLADFVEVTDPAWEKGVRRRSCTKSWNTWWWAAGTKRSAAWN